MSGENEDEVHWFRLLHNTGSTQDNYIMFAPPPSDAKFQTPVWVTNTLSHQDSWEVHTTAPMFAWAGRQYTTGESADKKTRIAIEKSHEVYLAKKDENDQLIPGSSTLHVSFGDELPDIKDGGKTSTKLGAFTVDIKKLPQDDGSTYVFGFGKRNGPGGEIFPCASIVANKTGEATVTPIIKLYFYKNHQVSEDKPALKTGDLIDFDNVVDEAGLIDFSDQGAATLCTVINKTDEEGNPVWHTAYTNDPPN
ncbi:hypothetical protein BO94DRAFT_589080 [Aspergillus sclerotioniger CBS 115572]|uniref:Uncharacterized protein n=1 Tax=Aspergillus sclerotioniger CBS 115572 TaxID=1450535 RepID=A0A317VTK9_9EURO|nr:hypothetical protein BO94DRAFT_589080 [Aspergillus sclerotioniger CBS 115572]PWY75270.1 hypothetical protein BO94DRAFT_589080 [Aspergillus sclerotioniger CBS 115572]